MAAKALCLSQQWTTTRDLFVHLVLVQNPVGILMARRYA